MLPMKLYAHHLSNDAAGRFGVNELNYRFSKRLLIIMNIDLLFSSLLGVVDRFRLLPSLVTGLFKVVVVIEVAYCLFYFLFSSRKLE